MRSKKSAAVPRRFAAVGLTIVLLLALAACGEPTYDLPDPDQFFKDVAVRKAGADRTYDFDRSDEVKAARLAYADLLVAEYGFTLDSKRDSSILYLTPESGSGDENISLDIRSTDKLIIRLDPWGKHAAKFKIVDSPKVYDPEDGATEPEKDPVPEPEPEPEQKPQTETKPEQKSEPEQKPQADTRPKPEPETKPESETKPEPEQKPEPEPEPEPAQKPEPEDRDGTLPDPYSFFNGDLSYKYDAKSDGSQVYITFNYKGQDLDPAQAYVRLVSDSQYGLSVVDENSTTSGEGEVSAWLKFDYTGQKSVGQVGFYNDSEPKCSFYISYWTIKSYDYTALNIWYAPDGFTFEDYGDRYSEDLTDRFEGSKYLNGILETVHPGEPSGESSGGVPNECTRCGGTGKVFCPSCGGNGLTQYGYGGTGNCFTCHGSGRVDCSICGGDGKR